MTIFIAIGGIGLVLLAASMLIGEAFEVGDGVLSGTGLGVGAVVFGAVGVITTANNLPSAVTYVGSAIAGVLAVVVVQVLVKRLQSTEDGLPVSLVGTTGVAKTDITPERGEVFLDAAQELERRMAWSRSPIPEGSRIVVVQQQGSRVEVTLDTPATEA
ncbi:NfeD-like partner-binding protein [Flavimobilis soli]|uniref:NfeD-like partner-binding protein n=1 Tax=Flavimobilis soli TaxID=442709 RepID=A0A2A9EEP2_9MICO|nr:NfeD family protein [Flavimobilis soli]PFG36755.1 NfeD-like partner-binding protein [Flavimobilis soli]